MHGGKIMESMTACQEFSDAPGSASALFKVVVLKLKAAFLWLKANNPYYANVEWREDAAAAWTVEDVQVGTTREADDDVSHVPPATPAVATLISEAPSESLLRPAHWTVYPAELLKKSLAQMRSTRLC